MLDKVFSDDISNIEMKPDERTRQKGKQFQRL